MLEIKNVYKTFNAGRRQTKIKSENNFSSLPIAA